MLRPKNLSRRLFTDRVKLEKILIDETEEVLLEAQIYDYQKQKFLHAEVTMRFEVFKDILTEVDDQGAKLLDRVTDCIVCLQREEIKEIDVREVYQETLELNHGVFCFERYTYEGLRNALRKAEMKFDLGLLYHNEYCKYDSKIGRSDDGSCYTMFAFIPSKPPVTVCRLVELFARRYRTLAAIAYQIYDLLLRHEYYLVLREARWTFKQARNFTGLKDNNSYAIVARIYNTFSRNKKVA